MSYGIPKKNPHHIAHVVAQKGEWSFNPACRLGPPIEGRVMSYIPPQLRLCAFCADKEQNDELRSMRRSHE